MPNGPNVDVIVVGTGNAGLCAAIAAREKGASVLMIEKADESLAGGNTQYTAGAMRFAYNNGEDLLPLLTDPDDPRLAVTDFGSYDIEQFGNDLLSFNAGQPLAAEQKRVVGESYDTLRWLASHGVRFNPIYARQSFLKDGRHVFWGGLTLAADNEGVGLFESEREAALRLGVDIRYSCSLVDLLQEGERVVGVEVEVEGGQRESISANAVVLACGGFESSEAMRVAELGKDWAAAKPRGTPNNTGDGLALAWGLGADRHGNRAGCHATPMDRFMKDYGDLDLPAGRRKLYRKICYFLGVMLNANGQRFVDEGENFRNYTYAQFGRAILEQPGHIAWQIFDAKVSDLLYDEYRFEDAHFVEADSLDGLLAQIDDLDTAAALATLNNFNAAVDDSTPFDPTIKDGKSAEGLSPPRANWAQKLDTPPYRAYPVTCGITFTYGGVRVSDSGGVVREDRTEIPGLFACGEMVGGVFVAGYPGGSGLTSGAVFGRLAGYGAANS